MKELAIGENLRAATDRAQMLIAHGVKVIIPSCVARPTDWEEVRKSIEELEQRTMRADPLFHDVKHDSDYRLSPELVEELGLGPGPYIKASGVMHPPSWSDSSYT